MSRTSRAPAIVCRRSTVHGFGVFAAEAIVKNARIIDYAGELIRNDEACEAREARYLAEGCTWIFCTPNCYFEVVDKTIWIKAARTIRRGEELTHNYSIIGEPARNRPVPPGLPEQI